MDLLFHVTLNFYPRARPAHSRISIGVPDLPSGRHVSAELSSAVHNLSCALSVE